MNLRTEAVVTKPPTKSRNWIKRMTTKTCIPVFDSPPNPTHYRRKATWRRCPVEIFHTAPAPARRPHNLPILPNGRRQGQRQAQPGPLRLGDHRRGHECLPAQHLICALPIPRPGNLAAARRTGALFSREAPSSASCSSFWSPLLHSAAEKPTDS